MTLRELMYKVDDASRVERVPSVIKIVESGSPVVSSMKMGDEIEVTAFKNGFVIYQNGIRATVFPLHKCMDYVEKDVTEKEHVLPFEAFADQPLCFPSKHSRTSPGRSGPLWKGKSGWSTT